jgi:hypothetical protein
LPPDVIHHAQLHDSRDVASSSLVAALDLIAEEQKIITTNQGEQ